MDLTPYLIGAAAAFVFQAAMAIISLHIELRSKRK